MRIICDSREKTCLDFSKYDATVIPGTLHVGDYAPAGLGHLCAVERKSLPDLVASLTRDRERFERELQRARGLTAFAVVIEGTLEQVRLHHYRSKALPHSILQSMTALTVKYAVTWVWAATPTGAAYFTYHHLRHFVIEAELRYKDIIRLHCESHVEVITT